MTRAKAIENFKKACRDLAAHDLSLFGWSGTLTIIESKETKLPPPGEDDCYWEGDTGHVIVDHVYEIHCDGGDPDHHTGCDGWDYLCS